MMHIFFNRIHYPVTTLGYGKRTGVWFQGCSIHCPGCVAPDMWYAEEKHRVKMEWVQAALSTYLAKSDGISISGGEPFNQSEALICLLRWVREVFDGDILLYSGYSEVNLRHQHPEAFELVDAMVLEPFVAELPDSRAFIGSSNQRLLLLTPLAEERYRNLDQMLRGFTVDFRDNEIMLAGVPERNFMKSFKEQLNQAGIKNE